MENHLEHKIEKAYQEKDLKSSYPRKEELWKRIAAATKSKSGVHGFWRIAAVLLAAFFLTSVFAGTIFINKKNQQLAQSESRYKELIKTLDSLKTVPPKVITEIKYIEKEVKVLVPGKNPTSAKAVQNEQFEKLTAENVRLRKQLIIEMEYWQNKTDSIQQQLIAFQNSPDKIVKPETKPASLFTLKPEVNKEVVQQPAQGANPKIKMQLFKNPNEGVKFDMNSTIFRK